jgi:hypothetical protein
MDMRALLAKNKRLALLLGALAVTFIAVLVSNRDQPAEDLVVEPVSSTARSASRTPAPAAAEDFDLEKLRRPRSDIKVAELFGTDPEPAGQASTGNGMAPGAQAPVEAALPFRYMGKVIDEGRTSVFLAQGDDQHHSVQAGQTVSGYRVDQVTDDAITFTHLETKTKKVLQVPPLN